jgi:hypothetical protein
MGNIDASIKSRSCLNMPGGTKAIRGKAIVDSEASY